MNQQVLKKLSSEIQELNTTINCKWLHLHAMEHVLHYCGDLHPYDMRTLHSSIAELQVLRGYKLGLEKAVITTVRAIREEYMQQQLA